MRDIVSGSDDNEVMEKMPPRIMLVEPDTDERNGIAGNIERYWFSVVRLDYADIALRTIDMHLPHLAIISAEAAPDGDLSRFISGVQSLNLPRQIPLMLVLQLNDTRNYSELDNGLMDIVHKPVNYGEIMVGIKNLLSRCKPELRDRALRYKNIVVDRASYSVTVSGKRVHVGPTEFGILELLVAQPTRIFSRRQIVDYVWGIDSGRIEERTVDVHVNRLRTALKAGNIKAGGIIQTIRSMGYCLTLPGEDS